MVLELLSDLSSTSILVLSLASLAITWFYSASPKTNGLPPTPALRLPLIGHLHLLPSNPRKKLMEWGEKHGPVFSLYFGKERVIFLHGYDVIKEAFVKNAAVFSERPNAFVTELLSRNKGFMAPHWKIQRKVSLEILRQLGYGTNVMENRVQQEISRFLQVVEEKGGQPFDPREDFLRSISNLVCALVFGDNYRHDDPVIASCSRLMGEQISIAEGAMVLKFLPFLQYLPGDLFGLKKAIEIRDHLEDKLIRKQLELKKKALSEKDREENQTSDFITGYLRAMERERKRGTEADACLNEDNLVGVINNLFAGGTEATSKTLCWTVLYLLHHPEVEEKCYKQILEVVGSNRRPELSDRQRLPYVEATVLEILRICNISPYGIHHSVSEDITFRGHHLPKDTVIMANLDSVQHSGEIWGDPYTFRPERFLDESQEVVVQRNEAIPFSIGKRSCPGEYIAKMELFLFTSTLIQTFHFRVKEGSQLPSLTDKFGLACSPLPYEVCMVPRRLC